MVRYFSFMGLLLMLFVSGIAQSPSVMFTKELNIKFDGLEIKKLERAAKLVNDGQLMLQQANDMYNKLTEKERNDRFSDAYKASLKRLYESSETSKEAYETVYTVFKYKNDAFWQKMSRNNHRASGMDKARYYAGSALKNYNRSLIRRTQVQESDLYEYSREIMEDALEGEILAVRDQGRSLQICMDYPVEYNYGWDDDKSLEEIVKLMKNPIIHEPAKDIFATVDKTAPVDSSLLKKVFFKVQIAAHTQPLSQEYLNLFYKGSLPIDLIYEENWYKYSVGIYNTFEEADATRIEMNIKKAFVVAYCDGKKIPVKDAAELVKKKKEAGVL
jgi:hypothetical protein